MTTVTGASKICLMVGMPVDKARTPALFNGWAARTGRDVTMIGAAIEARGLDGLFAAMRGWTNCVGAVVTYPHKQAAFAALDEADATARFNEACNVIRRSPDGRLSGVMTDGVGCVGAMTRNGARLEGADMLLIGAGGAGSAIAYEAARRGARRIVVLDLDAERGAALAARLKAAFPDLVTLTDAPGDFRFDVACNATPLGMNGETALPYPVEAFAAHTLVVDVVPTPAVTPWLAAARARGLRIQTGPEMVAAQFAHVAGHVLGEAPAEIERALSGEAEV